jgi:proline iminopeptidase
MLNVTNYKIMGHGNPLYIIHGGTMLDTEYMVKPLEKLSDNNELVFIDLHGRGTSPYPGDSLNNFIHDINYIDSIRQYLGHHKINILGHSFGGFIALAYVKLYPNDVNKAVIVSTPININDSIFGIKQQELLLKLSVDTIKNKYDNLKLLKYLNIYDTNLVKKEYLRNFEISMLTQDTAKHFKKMERLYNESISDNWLKVFNTRLLNINSNFFKEFKNIQFLLIYGKYDNVAFIDRQPSYKSKDNVKLRIYDKSSHIPFYEQNEQFVKELKEFLK